MDKKVCFIRRWWRAFIKGIFSFGYRIYKYFHTSKRAASVMFVSLLSGGLFVLLTLWEGLRNMWPDFFGALSNTIFGIFISSIYFLIKVIFEDRHKVIQEHKLLENYYGNEYNLNFRMDESGDLFSFIFAEEKNLDFNDINFITLKEEYELPDIVSNTFIELYNAHYGSYKVNFHTVRLNHYKIKDNTLNLYIQKSTFYNHLVTNRATDLPINNEMSLRDLFEPGPKLVPLEKSVFSNHLGVICLVNTSDKKTILFHRSRTATTSKNKLTTAVAIGLRVPKEYGFNEDEDIINKESFLNHLYTVIEKSMFVSKEDIKELNFLGIGRDIHEGGKPQMFMAAELNISSSEFNNNFNESLIKNENLFKNNKKDLKKAKKEYNKIVKKFKKNKEDDELKEQMINYEQNILNNLKEDFSHLEALQRSKLFDKTTGFYITSLYDIGFYKKHLLIDGISNDNKKVNKFLKGESSLLMALYYYQKRYPKRV